MSTHFYRPAEGHRLAHNPLNAIIAPRPIGWIGTVSASGTRNLAPYSFFNAFGYEPPLIGFAATSRKHTIANIAATREFTWNLVTAELAEAMNQTSIPAEVDEFARAGLAAAPSVEIAAPRVGSSPVNFECRLAHLIELSDAAGLRTGGWLVVGEVVAVHIDQRLITDGVYDTAAGHPVQRGGGPTAYYGLDPATRFDLTRPHG